jgi:hypothetical protein
LFVRIKPRQGDDEDFWEVSSNDRMVSVYGALETAGGDPAWSDSDVTVQGDFKRWKGSSARVSAEPWNFTKGVKERDVTV